MENVIEMLKYISHSKILIFTFFKLWKDNTTLNLPINITGVTIFYMSNEAQKIVLNYLSKYLCKYYSFSSE